MRSVARITRSPSFDYTNTGLAIDPPSDSHRRLPYYYYYYYTRESAIFFRDDPS